MLVLGSLELLSQLSLFLLNRLERLLHFAPEIRLGFKFIVGISNAFFSHKDLLSDLHKSNKGITHKEYMRREKGNELKILMKLYSPL